MFDKFKLKHRYLLTQSGNIRLRYILSFVAVFTVCIAIAVLTFSEETKEKTIIAAIPDLQDSVKIIKYDPEKPGNGIAPFMSRIGMRPVFDKPYMWDKTITVERGDSLGLLLEDTGLTGDDYVTGLKALEKYVDPTTIKPGHKIIVTNMNDKDISEINKISYVYDSLTSVHLTRNTDGKWQAQKIERPLEIKTHAATLTIENSIYGSMGKAGVPDGIINQMIMAYSWTVDFQRDIWGDEGVEVLYETKETDDGEYVRSHRLLYANLKLRNKEMPIYLFEKDKGYPNYFEPNGQSIRRTLMKTPIDGARLSSGYGMRKHPVLGYSKMHAGIDFAAPIGTPIFAAGDGVVQRANRFSSYGNYIKIRHNATYSTAYAHLSRFAKGISAGTRVKQGQVIGYVGNTGRSTGPHLHYEIHKNGNKVNPLSVDLPLGEQLGGKQLANFKNTVAERRLKFKSLSLQ